MDTNNWRSSVQNGQPADDWRAVLQPDLRQSVVNRIIETLKRHLPFSGQEGEEELKRIAVRFEEKICSTATNQFDYCRKIALKMQTMEGKKENYFHPLPSLLPFYASGSNNLPRGTEVNIMLGVDSTAANTTHRKRQKKNDGGEVVDEVIEVHNSLVESDEPAIVSYGSTIKECNKKLDEMQMLAMGDPLYIAACCIFCESKAHREQWIMLSAKPEEVRIDWIKMVAKHLGYL